MKSNQTITLTSQQHFQLTFHFSIDKVTQKTVLNYEACFFVPGLDFGGTIALHAPHFEQRLQEIFSEFVSKSEKAQEVKIFHASASTFLESLGMTPHKDGFLSKDGMFYFVLPESKPALLIYRKTPKEDVFINSIKEWSDTVRANILTFINFPMVPYATA